MKFDEKNMDAGPGQCTKFQKFLFRVSHRLYWQQKDEESRIKKKVEMVEWLHNFAALPPNTGDSRDKAFCVAPKRFPKKDPHADNLFLCRL